MKREKIIQIIRFVFLSTVCVTFFTGCKTFQAYPGPARPREQLAVLVRQNPWLLSKGILLPTKDRESMVFMGVESVDGFPVGDNGINNGTSVKIMLLPGEHTIRFIGAIDRSIRDPVYRKLSVEAGKTYIARAYCHWSPPQSGEPASGTWRVDISEK